MFTILGVTEIRLSRQTAFQLGRGAALACEIAEQSIHHIVIGPADQAGRRARLCHETGQNQRLQVMRQRRGVDSHEILDAADGQPLIASLREDLIDPESRGVGESLEAAGGRGGVHREYGHVVVSF